MNNKIIIKKTLEKGKGVFAQRNIHQGEIVVIGKLIKKVLKRTTHSFQLGPEYHVQLDIIARSINHSCDPNTGIRNNFYGGYDFVAMKKIKEGDEITWDYETSEYISIAVNICHCGSKNCRKYIKGFKYINKKIKDKYGEFISNYLKPK